MFNFINFLSEKWFMYASVVTIAGNFIVAGVAIGSGWQATVAYINLGCYYIIGLPLGFLIGWVFKLGVGVTSAVPFSSVVA